MKTFVNNKLTFMINDELPQEVGNYQETLKREFELQKKELEFDFKQKELEFESQERELKLDLREKELNYELDRRKLEVKLEERESEYELETKKLEIDLEKKKLEQETAFKIKSLEREKSSESLNNFANFIIKTISELWAVAASAFLLIAGISLAVNDNLDDNDVGLLLLGMGTGTTSMATMMTLQKKNK